MKKIVFIILTAMCLTTYGQDKNNYIHFDVLTEIVGTEFVIASNGKWVKFLETKNRYLLFINTKTGEINQVDFLNDNAISNYEQIKIDSLGINLILVSAKTVDLDGNNRIDWMDPTQIIILSIEGKTKTQLTDNNFFIRSWTVNKFTGTIVVVGHYDTNDNDKYDNADKNEIYVYDLKTLKLIYKL